MIFFNFIIKKELIYRLMFCNKSKLISRIKKISEIDSEKEIKIINNYFQDNENIEIPMTEIIINDTFGGFMLSDNLLSDMFIIDLFNLLFVI